MVLAWCHERELKLIIAFGGGNSAVVVIKIQLFEVLHYAREKYCTYFVDALHFGFMYCGYSQYFEVLYELSANNPDSQYSISGFISTTHLLLWIV